jgi:hypothetical protein
MLNPTERQSAAYSAGLSVTEPDSGLANVRADVQKSALSQPRHAAASPHFRGQWGACAGLKMGCLASSLLA